MRLYFARHGESEANTRHVISNRDVELGLTSLGKQQAKTLAENLHDISFRAMFCSPVFRARETAEILSSSLNVPYQVTEALREYDCGILEEQSDEESWRLHRDYFESWVLHHKHENKPEGGESFLDIQKRFVPFIQNLMDNDVYKNSNLLLIGHGGLFLLMLPVIFSNVDHPFATLHGIGNAEYILAEQWGEQLVCLQWGQVILQENINK